jgi:hypothetical protein
MSFDLEKRVSLTALEHVIESMKERDESVISFGEIFNRCDYWMKKLKIKIEDEDSEISSPDSLPSPDISDFKFKTPIKFSFKTEFSGKAVQDDQFQFQFSPQADNQTTADKDCQSKLQFSAGAGLKCSSRRPCIRRGALASKSSSKRGNKSAIKSVNNKNKTISTDSIEVDLDRLDLSGESQSNKTKSDLNFTFQNFSFPNETVFENSPTTKSNPVSPNSDMSLAENISYEDDENMNANTRNVTDNKTFPNEKTSKTSGPFNFSSIYTNSGDLKSSRSSMHSSSNLTADTIQSVPRFEPNLNIKKKNGTSTRRKVNLKSSTNNASKARTNETIDPKLFSKSSMNQNCFEFMNTKDDVPPSWWSDELMKNYLQKEDQNLDCDDDSPRESSGTKIEDISNLMKNVNIQDGTSYMPPPPPQPSFPHISPNILHVDDPPPPYPGPSETMGSRSSTNLDPKPSDKEKTDVKETQKSSANSAESVDDNERQHCFSYADVLKDQGMRLYSSTEVNHFER